jgi:3-hydroxyacyl-[acyl-carrier-protein] dehydratase
VFLRMTPDKVAASKEQSRLDDPVATVAAPRLPDPGDAAPSIASSGALGPEELLRILPHRPPFLFVDRIEAHEPGRRAVGLKCVAANEQFFAGHFPGRPIMPGVLVLEALAQVGAVAILTLPEFAGRLALFGGVDGVRFRRPVVPGDVLRLEVEIVRRRGPLGVGRGVATVNGVRAAEAELKFAVAVQ